LSIQIIFRDQSKNLPRAGTLSKALKILEVSPQSVLAIRNGQLITEDEMLQDGDIVELISVISGG